MRLKDVNGVEADSVAVLHSELVQGGNLPPKRRSGVAPKDQHDWFVDPEQREIRRAVVLQPLDH